MTAIVVGSGHLAIQIAGKLERKGGRVARVESQRSWHSLSLDDCKSELAAAGIDAAERVFIVDQDDRVNIQFALATLALNASLSVVLALYNQKVAPHFRVTHPNLRVENPAAIAAPHFVEALYLPISRRTLPSAIPEKEKRARLHWIRTNTGLLIIGGWFLLFLTSATVFFRFHENLTWINAIYFVVTMATTTGFGDINLLQSTTLAKSIGAITMLLSLATASIFFSLLVDRLIRRRTELFLGRKKYSYAGHVVLCGLGRVGYEIAELILARKQKLIIIEQDENNRFLDALRGRGADVLIGDATLDKNLRDVGISKALALISATSDDLVNLEIGLSARALRPDMKLVLRIFDEETAKQIKEQLDIHLALSASTIAAEKLVS